MATAKDELKLLLEQQPEDSSSEELVRELAFHIMVQKGLTDSDNGRTISNEEMNRRIRSWAAQTGLMSHNVGSKTFSNS